ncbi:hypothetical protein J6590_096180 [Homalodisca vitripennis]|nr:hypothetical protein J6590_082313 [Homalodisca vitripennis]KAG8294748.1 hypothetical protein J6590_096180 [Homalodisca vitripennis]
MRVSISLRFVQYNSDIGHSERCRVGRQLCGNVASRGPVILLVAANCTHSVVVPGAGPLASELCCVGRQLCGNIVWARQSIGRRQLHSLCGGSWCRATS